MLSRPDKTSYRLMVNGTLLLYMLLSAMLFYGCSQKRASNNDTYSREYKSIQDTTYRLFEHNHINEALQYVDASVKQLPYLTTADRFSLYSLHYVALNKIKHDNEKALLYADSMLITANQFVAKERYLSAAAEAHFARGDALFELGRYSQSYTAYYQGYLLGRSNLDNCTLSAYSYRLGMITYKQSNYKNSVTYFKESLRQSRSCKDEFPDFFRRQEVLDNIALSYRNQQNPDSALVYFNLASQYLDENSTKYKDRADIIEVAHAVIYGNLADVLNMQGNYNQAITLLKRSIATNSKKGNDLHDAQLSEVKLIELYMKTGQGALAAPLLKNLRKQLDSLPAADAEAGWNQMMGKYYHSKNNLAKALQYTENAHRIKDSLAERSRSLKDYNINEQLGNLEKQYQIVALRNQQRTYLWLGIALACMSTVIIALIYRNWKRSHKEMKLVNNLNQQVIAQKADLQKTLDELKLSSQEKDRILRTVAHDLRNPLGGIASLTSTMIEDTDYNNEQIELLKVIKETAYDSIELINEILEATNSSPGELHKQPVDINTLLNNSVELMRFKAAEKNQRIMLNILDTPEELMISREKIWRVISNLISNAIKFSPVGADIRVDLIKQKDNICIAVNDHGIGIPEEDKHKIFNMFTDAKRPGTLGEKSFGLGLSICRQIIERHHGKIWFESNTANGTTFFIQLSRAVKPEPVTA